MLSDTRTQVNGHDKPQAVDIDAIPGQDIIGAGYSPFVSYASPIYAVSHIFEWNNAPKDTFIYKDKIYSLPAAVDASVISSSSYTMVTAQDIQSYQQKLAQSVNIDGQYNFFSGSLKEDFDLNSLTNGKSAFTRIQQNIYTWSLQLTIDQNTRKLLRESLRIELDNLDISKDDACKEFFQRYASHIITGALFGGRALRTSATNKYSVGRNYDISVAANQSFKFASGKANAEEKLKYEEVVARFNEHSETIEKVEGGQVDKGAQVFSGKKLSFEDWETTVIENPIFVDFLAQNPLTPIWKLCANDEAGQKISAALEAYYNNTWAPETSNALTILPDYIDSLAIATGDTREIPPVEGYQKLEFDLNATVRGKYIFLCYHKERANAYGGNKKAMTDITIIYGDAAAPEGYIKIGDDLNRDTGGERVYLCYKLEEYNSDTATLDITAFSGKTPEISAPYGYTKVGHDLNKGSRGEYIFFAYLKQQ